MRKWPLILGFVTLALIIRLILLTRGFVVAEAQLDKTGQRVQIRELQFDFSIEGILIGGRKLYRVEYYRRNGEPLVACVSPMGDSISPGKFEIEWLNFKKAIVREDGVIRYTLDNEVWRVGR